MNTGVGEPGPEIDPAAPRRDPAPAPHWAGPAAGLVAAVCGLATAELVAGLIGAVSPYDAVGAAVVDSAPEPVVAWAIDWFGTADKAVLRAVMIVVMVLLAAAAGSRARAGRRGGSAIVGAAGVFGAAVVATRPDAAAVDPFAPLVGTAIAVAVLRWLAGLAAAADPATRPGWRHVDDDWDRRRFVGLLGALTASAAALGAGTRRFVQQRSDAARVAAGDALARIAPPIESPAPAVPVGATLSPVTPFITPTASFYRIDTALSFPRTELDDWSLTVDGLVDRPQRWTYDDLLARSTVERIITIACVSNEVGGDLVGTATWQGVLLADLLAEAGVQPGAEQVFSTSLDGWTCGFPVAAALDGRDAMVALLMNGEPLPLRHGFPARLVVPGLYGYVSATKWLERIELTTWDADVGYWVPRGWAREAPIVTQSRIDVPRRGEDVVAGEVVVAGVAWAPHRGVSRVEVRIDEGDWQEADLGDTVGDDAWRQWRLVWRAEPGEHVLRVRATDGAGEVQTAAVARPDPSGATGHHTRRVRVV